MIPVIIGHAPAGASTQQMVHYGQLVRSAFFRQYDHGWLTNRRLYGQRTPPNYNLSNIRAPVALHYSLNDWMAEPVDVYELSRGLPNLVGLYQISDPLFNHLDFVWGIDVRELVFNNVIKVMQEFETR